MAANWPANPATPIACSVFADVITAGASAALTRAPFKPWQPAQLALYKGVCAKATGVAVMPINTTTVQTATPKVLLKFSRTRRSTERIDSLHQSMHVNIICQTPIVSSEVPLTAVPAGSSEAIDSVVPLLRPCIVVNLCVPIPLNATQLGIYSPCAMQNTHADRKSICPELNRNACNFPSTIFV